jgi:hypothetical protein
MSDSLIEHDTYFEIKDYVPIIETDSEGNVLSVIHCPYIPKLLIDSQEIPDSTD